MTFTLGTQAQLALEAPSPVLVLGGPGSGKTTLSLLKTQRLVPTLQPGQQVLFLSFSRAAVQQVITRCKDTLLPDERKRIEVRTYHAFAMEILRSHGRLLNGRAPSIYLPGPERVDKSRFDGDQQAWELELRRIADEDSRYAFDLFAEYAARLIAGSTKVRDLIASRYPVIILDEFQDTDDAQWDLVQALAPSVQLIALADPDQRIFDYDPHVDPKRLDYLRTKLAPAEFDLGNENHRSPDAHILNFADAVLRNRQLPQTSDVEQHRYHPKNMNAKIRVVVGWTYAKLLNAGVTSPTIAVLCRTNDVVNMVSTILSTEQTHNSRVLPPIRHQVIWDTELTNAAAHVVASILEWPGRSRTECVAATLDAVAEFYDMKNALNESKASKDSAKKFRTAALAVSQEKAPRPDAAKLLLEIATVGAPIEGDPLRDWGSAIQVLGSCKLADVVASARFVRLTRTPDDIGAHLAHTWAETGSYGEARRSVGRILSRQQVTAATMQPSGVLLMNLHKSKGKEFDAVVLVEGWQKGRFFSDRPEDHESARRLLRVGITRAKRRVAFVRPVDAYPLTSPPPAP